MASATLHSEHHMTKIQPMTFVTWQQKLLN